MATTDWYLLFWNWLHTCQRSHDSAAMDATSAWECGRNRLVSSLLKSNSSRPFVCWYAWLNLQRVIKSVFARVSHCLIDVTIRYLLDGNSKLHACSLGESWWIFDEHCQRWKGEFFDSRAVRDFVLPAGFLGECWHPHVVWLCIYALLLLCHGVLTVEVQVYNLRNAVIDVFSNRNAANKLFCKLCTLIICILPFLPSTVKCTAWFCICISLSFL